MRTIGFLFVVFQLNEMESVIRNKCRKALNKLNTLFIPEPELQSIKNACYFEDLHLIPEYWERRQRVELLLKFSKIAMTAGFLTEENFVKYSWDVIPSLFQALESKSKDTNCACARSRYVTSSIFFSITDSTSGEVWEIVWRNHFGPTSKCDKCISTSKMAFTRN